MRTGIGKSWDMDTDKPYFHVMPRDGWLNGDILPTALFYEQAVWYKEFSCPCVMYSKICHRWER